jgi:polyphosphate:AMP phosphotransferase
MFQTAELGQKVSRREFKKRELELRKQLLDLQDQVRADGSFPVLIDFGGVRGGGKGTSTNLLNKWMDASYIETHAYGEPSDEESERPAWWRFWRDLPPRGHIGIYLSGRYSKPLLDYVYGNSSLETFHHQLSQIRAFEQALADDGALILKFWMHVSAKRQKKRLETLEHDPLHSWRVSPEDWTHWQMYDRFIEAAEVVVSRTSTGDSPWEIVEGGDYHFRSLRVGEVLRDSLERHLKKIHIRRKYHDELTREINGEDGGEAAGSAPAPAMTVLDALDLSLQVSKKEYRKQMELLHARLNQLHLEAAHRSLSVILVFEGPDAAGKSGAIRQVTEALDARWYKIYPFSAPTDEEKAHHYLWRFWRCIPRQGRVTIFDRSWYGRVLVERIEGFANDIEWRRSYDEINNFEEILVEHGIVLLKFWIHVDQEEQLARFKAREETPYKRWKLTDEDWRNRARWEDYSVAAHKMIQATDKLIAPWVLVEGNNKPYARVKVLNAICDALEHAARD